MPAAIGEGACCSRPLDGERQPGRVEVAVGARGRLRAEQHRVEPGIGRQTRYGGGGVARRGERPPQVVAGRGQVGEGAPVGALGAVGGRLGGARRDIESRDPLLPVDELLVGAVALAPLELATLGFTLGSLAAAGLEHRLRLLDRLAGLVNRLSQLAGGAHGVCTAGLGVLDGRRPPG